MQHSSVALLFFLPRTLHGVLSSFLYFPYRTEGRIILLSTQKAKMKRNTHMYLLDSFFYLPTELFDLLHFIWRANHRDTVKDRAVTDPSTKKTPNPTPLHTSHLPTASTNSCTTASGAKRKKATRTIAVKFLFMKNCHLIPLKDFITRSLDWINNNSRLKEAKIKGKNYPDIRIRQSNLKEWKGRCKGKQSCNNKGN